jgi:peptidoglycan hydrolase CwlO-like protein
MNYYEKIVRDISNSADALLAEIERLNSELDEKNSEIRDLQKQVELQE